MKNSDSSYAERYHQATKHSEIRIRTAGHYLDWNNKPSQFKTYEDLPSTPLPRDFPVPESDPLASISGLDTRGQKREVDIRALSELLFFSAGLTRRYRHGGEVHYMRAASATGALYPIEVYLVSRDIGGLKAGVYHFNPLDFSLTQLRHGDYRAELAGMSNQSIGLAPATLIFTSLAWRNAWKYQARSYRHWFWDSGVMVANLLAVSNSMGILLRLIAGFVDETVNLLLGLEKGKEAAILLAPLGVDEELSPDGTLKTISSIRPKVIQNSGSQVAYPEIWDLHQASSLSSLKEVRAWVENGRFEKFVSDAMGSRFKVSSEGTGYFKQERLGTVILQRGSTRGFARSPISFTRLSAIVRSSSSPLPLDYNHDGRESMIEIYLIANAVEKLASGSYFYDGKRGELEQLRAGEMRRTSAFLCLEQSLFGEASVVFFLMIPLQKVLRMLGNRGYRAAQLEGGIIAGRIYLSAYSLGLGASGSTFYDDAVTEFFSPHASDSSTMIAVGVGVPAYRARSGRVLPQFS